MSVFDSLESSGLTSSSEPKFTPIVVSATTSYTSVKQELITKPIIEIEHDEKILKLNEKLNLNSAISERREGLRPQQNINYKV